jgi:hypothetical protein
VNQTAEQTLPYGVTLFSACCLGTCACVAFTVVRVLFTVLCSPTFATALRVEFSAGFRCFAMFGVAVPALRYLGAFYNAFVLLFCAGCCCAVSLVSGCRCAPLNNVVVVLFMFCCRRCSLFVQFSAPLFVAVSALFSRLRFVGSRFLSY